MIRAVLFDLDETLLTRGTAIRAFIADQYDRHRDALADIDRAAFIARFLTLEDGGRTAKAMVYAALTAELGITRLSADDLLADYQAVYPRYSILNPGARETLIALRERGLATGIITNGNGIVQNGKIDAIGLRPLLDVVLVSEVEGMSKPDPALFALALRRLGVAAADAVFVGDNPTADVDGAHRAGLNAVWFHSSTEWPANLAPPVHTITELSALVPLIAEMNSP